MSEAITRAHLDCLDDASLSMTVPFNPTSVKIGRRVTWAEQAVHGQPWSTLQFSSGGSDTLNVSLLLDESESDGSVMPLVRQLHSMTLPALVSGEEGGARPPCVVFSWGEIRFQGVVQSLDWEFLLFDASGRPKRVLVGLTMLGRAFAGASGAREFFSQPWTASAGWGGWGS